MDRSLLVPALGTDAVMIARIAVEARLQTILPWRHDTVSRTYWRAEAHRCVRVLRELAAYQDATMRARWAAMDLEIERQIAASREEGC